MLDWTLDSGLWTLDLGSEWVLGEKHSARSSHPNLATVKEIWEIAVRGRVGVGRGEVCVVPVLCLSLGLVLSRHFFFPYLERESWEEGRKSGFFFFPCLDATRTR